jgi:hypothetical protein
MLDKRFSSTQLTTILKQAVIYDCACPAQIVNQLMSLNALYDYQANCLNQTNTDCQVHERIAAAVHIAYAEMESCLDAVLDMEGWDRASLTMPANLQKRLLDSLTAVDDPAADY